MNVDGVTVHDMAARDAALASFSEWLQRTGAQHRCRLVSVANPNGLPMQRAEAA